MSKFKKIICSVTAVIGLITGGVSVSSSDYTAPVGAVKIDGEVVAVLRVSPRALELIGNAEGCRRDPYRCPSGLITNGIGNTHDVIQSPVTDQQIAKDWVKNIAISEQCLFDIKSDLELSQGQIDAFTSFIFNTGCTRFRKNGNGSDTQISTLIKAGHYELACYQLNRWVYGGGVKLPGLITRRDKETQICLLNNDDLVAPYGGK
uniref:Lysozyme n=1 Tax=Aliivibrio phage vB_Alvi_H905 TaxID=3234039 RepID=A0AB39C9Q2_9VIRU